MKYLSEKTLRLVINGIGNTSEEIQLHVGGSKHIFIYVFLASLFEKDEKMPIILKNVPNISDVSFLYQYAIDAGADVEWNSEEKDITINRGILLNNINPAYVVNCRSSLIAFTLHAIRFGEATMINDIGGCKLGERKIDQHCRLWNSMGYVFSVENSEMSLKRKKDYMLNDCFRFELDTTMGTVAALYALSHGMVKKIDNASIRYEIDELINFYNCLGYKIQRINRHIELKDSSSKKYGGIIFIIPDDIDETIGWTCLCHALGKRGIVYSHVPRQYVWNWLELHSNKEIIWTQNKIIILPRKKYCKKSELSIVAFQNSKIASDQQPILAVWGSCFYNKVRITDKKFFNRYDYISELKKLGWHGEVDKESAWIEYRGRINSTEEPLLIANNLRSGFAVMMGILINREKAELLRFEQLKRGYSQLQNNLESIGVMYNVEDIPKSESVAVILQRKDGRYYVQQRDSNAVKNPEKITLFGGHVESGELPDQAIKRELQEELELEINCELIEVFQVSKPLFSTSGLIYLYCARNIGDLKICHEGKILLLDRQKICEQDTSFFLRCILGMRFI